MRRLASFALAVVLFALLAAPIAADTVFVPLALRGWPPPALTFTVAGGNGANIYQQSPSTGDLVPVTDTPTLKHSPAWSPDRRRVAYTLVDGDRYNLAVYDTLTGQQTRLTDTAWPDIDVSPAWSPDGQRIAYTCRRDGLTHICVVAADGSDRRQLTTGGNRYDDPAWSPDGSRLAFSMVNADRRHICHMAADGSDIRCITDGVQDNSPSWSPDGQQIAFASTRSGTWSIYTVSAGGGAATQVTLNDYPAIAPSWSPDGRRIAFVSWFNDASQTHVRVIDLSNGDAAMIDTPGPALSPAWR